METGFIGLYRKIRDWGWYTDVPVFKLFIHLVISANYTDKEWKGIPVKRGQFISSYDKLALATGISYQEVRTALIKLEKTKEIVKKSTNKHTLITVVNYGYYQDFNNMNNKQRTNKKQTKNKPTTTTKERKERKERKEESTRAFDFLKIHYEITLNNWVMLNKKDITYFEKFVMDFNDTVDVEGLAYTDKILFGRLNKYARNWIQNQDKFKAIKNECSLKKLSPRKIS